MWSLAFCVMDSPSNITVTAWNVLTNECKLNFFSSSLNRCNCWMLARQPIASKTSDNSARWFSPRRSLSVGYMPVGPRTDTPADHQWLAESWPHSRQADGHYSCGSPRTRKHGRCGNWVSFAEAAVNSFSLVRQTKFTVQAALQQLTARLRRASLLIQVLHQAVPTSRSLHC